MRAILLAWTLGVASSGVGAVAAAADDDRPREPLAGSEANAARAHFEQALVHYRAGRYRAAILELGAAVALDPESKDLHYNLALVHEKLGDLDSAIASLERYVALEADPAEIERAEQAMLRMRGAREELARPAPPPPAPAALSPAAPAEAPSRIDGWLLATGGVTVAAAVVGVVFGVRALALRPGSDPRTDADTSIDDLRDDRRRARDAAIVADVGFAVSLAAGAATAALWFGRAPSCAPAIGRSSLAVAWSSEF